MDKKNNAIKLVNAQRSERYKALIFLGNLFNMTPENGKSIADILNAQYINIISEFSDNKSYAIKIDVFDADDLKKLLQLKTSRSEPIVVVDGIDMLWTIWSRYEKDKFMRMVEKNTISPYSNVVYIFLCIMDENLKEIQWLNDAHHSPRIVNVSELTMGGQI